METLLDTSKFDYILDCIDSVTPKLTLLKIAKSRKLKIISSMGLVENWTHPKLK